MSIFRYFVAVLAFVAGPAFAAELLIPAAPDFATQTLNNPWDMADDTDAHFWAHFPQIARTTTTLDNPFIPIDATRYTRLAFYMWLPETVAVGSTNGRILWHLGGESVAQFDANYSEAPIFPVYPGWHLYTFDL